MMREVLSGEPIRSCNASQERLFRVVERFWASAERYAAMGVPHKTGILLHGLPGTGKTVVLRKAIDQTIQAGGFALKLGALNELPRAIQAIRHHYPTAPILIYQDDMDSWLERDSDHEVDLTHMMDGTGSELNGCLVLGTTNHIEKFSDRLKRPGRFDHVVEIDPPALEERQSYLSELWKLPFNHPAVVETARVTEGHVLASIRGVAISRFLDGLENYEQQGEILAVPAAPSTADEGTSASKKLYGFATRATGSR
jgi:SpoVK/Ycf46/Vps4 family AAA+-type ATPase